MLLTVAMKLTCLALLALCLAPAKLSALGHHQSGIVGQIAYGRTCDASGCYPVPTPIRLLVYSDRDRLVADLTTEADGFFEVALKPGAYLVAPFFVPATADAPLVPVGQPIPVLVEKKDYTALSVHFLPLPQRPVRPPVPPSVPPPLPPIPVPH